MAQCDHRPARLGLVAVAALAAALFALPTDASAYAGWLTSAEMELSVPFFMLLTWEVTENPDHTWHYLYAFEIEDREPLFFILETSGDFTYDDILSVGGSSDGTARRRRATHSCPRTSTGSDSTSGPPAR